MSETPETADTDWNVKLDPARYQVLRKGATEPPFTGEYWNTKQKGRYLCAGCGTELFSSDTKFDSGSGWPSFWEPMGDDRVSSHVDRSHGMVRTEVTCSNCGGHLGHVFDDGPRPTGLRYCVNSLSLELQPED
ncbi:MAG: peptide-methionine (R)-S-oxide reductase MsrB [Acidimicrobiia bacterium]